MSNESDNGFVYFLEGNALVKIGVASDLENRLISIQNQSPIQLSLIGYIKTSTKLEAHHLETHLHNQFQEMRHHGEWFEKKCVKDSDLVLETNLNEKLNAVLTDAYLNFHKYHDNRKKAGLKILSDTVADKKRNNENTILQFLKDAPFPESVHQISQSVNISESKCRELLNELESSGKVRKAMGWGKKRPQKLFYKVT